jgi:Fe-S cluster assembly protein SufD
MTALDLRLNPAADPFQEDFAAHATGLPGAGLAWLDARRLRAIGAFARTGVPNRRVEAWKFTDLASLLEGDLEPAAGFQGEVEDENLFGTVPGARTLLVDGLLQEVTEAGGLELADLSTLGDATPDWVSANLGVLAAGAEQPMGAASLALMRGGVAIRVRNSQVLHLDFIKAPREHDSVSHTRVLIVIEEGVSLRLLESHTGQGGSQSLSNLGMEVVLKPGAKLEHVRLQAEGPAALNITSIGTTLARDAEYRALYAAMGARLSRLDIDVRLTEPGAHAMLHNVAILGSGIADTTTVMDHSAPHTASRQLFKSVVGGRGRAVNQGRVAVRKGAVKSDSHQLFKALLLSPRAEADAKPELEIFADDVVCGHGTAIGALDADALFYLRARGIPEQEAKGLLIRAFLDEAVEGFGDESVRDALMHRLDAAFAQLGGAQT